MKFWFRCFHVRKGERCCRGWLHRGRHKYLRPRKPKAQEEKP
jgi:hypothetical protein